MDEEGYRSNGAEFDRVVVIGAVRTSQPQSKCEMRVFKLRISSNTLYQNIEILIVIEYKLTPVSERFTLQASGLILAVTGILLYVIGALDGDLWIFMTLGWSFFIIGAVTLAIGFLTKDERENPSYYACLYCKLEIRPDYMRCPRCGGELKKRCTNCDNLLELWNRFCPFCGNSQFASPISLRPQSS